MNKPLVQTVHYRGKRAQPLSNVFIHAPTIIWVDQGYKQLWWHEQSIQLGRSNWIVVPAGQYLTFVNTPEQKQFHSRAMAFNLQPPAEWLQESLSDNEKISHAFPQIATTPQLEYCFNLVSDMLDKGLSLQGQKQIILGLYAELREVGALDLLFPNDQKMVRDKLANYLSSAPGDDHSIEAAASHLAMSRATLTRKLNAEGSSFREVLAEIRMNHAINLLQRNFTQLDTALACGYQSQTRFNQRFKQQFGLTPHQYQQTL